MAFGAEKGQDMDLPQNRPLDGMQVCRHLELKGINESWCKPLGMCMFICYSSHRKLIHLADPRLPCSGGAVLGEPRLRQAVGMTLTLVPGPGCRSGWGKPK